MPTQRDPDAPQPPEANAPRAQIEPLSPPHDGLLVPLLYDLTKPYIDAGLAHGTMPRLRSDEWLDAHPEQQIAHLLLCGISVAISPPHQTVAALLKSASRDVSQAVLDRGPSPDPLDPAARWKLLAARAEERADAEKRARLDAEARLRRLEQHHTARAS